MNQLTFLPQKSLTGTGNNKYREFRCFILSLFSGISGTNGTFIFYHDPFGKFTASALMMNCWYRSSCPIASLFSETSVAERSGRSAGRVSLPGAKFFHGLFLIARHSLPLGWSAALFDQKGAALFGYTNLYGGYDGGQEEYVRVLYADVGPWKISDKLSDEKALFLTDVFPTGYIAVDWADLKEAKR